MFMLDVSMESSTNPILLYFFLQLTDMCMQIDM